MIYSLWVFWIMLTIQTGQADHDNEDKGCPKFIDYPIEPCKQNPITFYLHTNENVELLNAYDPSKINKAPFIDGKEIKFIIHGHQQSPDDPSMEPIRLEYLKLNYNVIMVNYSELSKDPCYRTGIKNSIKIAKCSTQLIEKIVHNRGIDLKNFHIIGLSLGGQIAGQMSHFLTNKEDNTFSRITGIEPANEGFFDRYKLDEYVLTQNDADYVDVIHTNAGVMGKFRAMGHADFYANSGIFQPNCPPGNYLCSHLRSLLLFLESIGDTDMEVDAIRCKNLEMWYSKECPAVTSKIPFGEQAIKDRAEGIFFFQTKNEYPYIRKSNLQTYTKYPIYDIPLPYEPGKIDYHDGPKVNVNPPTTESILP